MNCPNCGAPMDYNGERYSCDYCGTNFSNRYYYAYLKPMSKSRDRDLAFSPNEYRYLVGLPTYKKGGD